MKRTRVGPILAAVIAALVATGCPMADYVLDFHNVTASVAAANSVTVSYSLYNAGDERLLNAMVLVKVIAYAADGDELGNQEYWSQPTSIDPGETVWGTLYFDFYGLASSIDRATVYVVEAAWDKEDGGFVFPFD